MRNTVFSAFWVPKGVPKGAVLLQELTQINDTPTLSEVHKLMTFVFVLNLMKSKSYTKFQLNMLKHVGEKCGNVLFPVFWVRKGAVLLQKLTQIDDTPT